MAKVLISFLGTNRYVYCNYYYQEISNKISNVHFVQEAIIKLFCGDFGENDRYLFFLTDAAKEANWIKSEYQDKEGNVHQDKGLQSHLTELGINPEEFPINNGYTNQEIWKIFEVIFNELKPDDEVIFDITHGFRSLPMLGMVLMNYSKILKKINIRGIYYGAFEALGPAYKVRTWDIEKRNAEILNLISFSILQEWSNAANDFITNGSTKGIEALIQKNPLSLILENPNQATFNKFEKLSNALNKMTLVLSTVRGNQILQAEIFKTVDKIANELKREAFIAPLQPILEQISNQVKRFKFVDRQSIMNTFEAVDWCIENKLIQQGITLLQESIITYLILFFDRTHRFDYRNYNDRTFMKDILLKENLLYEDKKISTKIYGYNSKILNNLRPHFKRFKKYRNDINHGGFLKDAKNEKEFGKELSKIRIEVKSIFEEYPIK